MELYTDRLILRDLTCDDFADMQAYASVYENVKYTSWGPNTDAETRAFLQEAEAHAKATPRMHYDFAIVLRDTGRMIGSDGIYLSESGEEGMLGWTIHRDFWGQGYGTEQAHALLRFGFETLKLHRIYADCFAENHGSYRVMEHCGMRREAHFIKNCAFETPAGRIWMDGYLYAMLAEEWEAKG